jgi:alpha-D-ribose 1-methylphosphonate 5-triphosphate synthase subunit PhnG
MTGLDDRLGTLARADASRLKSFAETLIPDLGEIDVLQSRTGLVMLPLRDTAGGVAFHLGEVLVSEAHIRKGEIDGYGMRRGHDLEASMAMALVDLALAIDVRAADCAAFCDEEARLLADEDRQVLRRVEATRVDMETF